MIGGRRPPNDPLGPDQILAGVVARVAGLLSVGVGSDRLLWGETVVRHGLWAMCVAASTSVSARLQVLFARLCARSASREWVVFLSRQFLYPFWGG